MRFLGKLVLKAFTMAIMIAILGAGIRFARPRLMKSAGLPGGASPAADMGKVHFSSEESDLMGTVFKSAIRLLTGNASRKELAGELSTKLYSGRADPATMKELGIELVQPGANPASPGEPLKPQAMPAVAAVAKPRVAEAVDLAEPPSRVDDTARADTLPRAEMSARTDASPIPGAVPGGSPAEKTTGSRRDAVLAQVRRRAMANPELALVPVVLTGMLVIRGFRRRRSPADDLVLPDMSALLPSDSEPYEMANPVHSLKAENFELLVALIYQRQGYRVSMHAGLSGGRGGDFILQRKSERLLVQCKNLRQDHRLPIERVRELQEAVETAGLTRGLYVASCGFTWDARNYAKGKGMTVINARTLDALITEARESPDEDLFTVANWAPKFMTKVKVTPPVCPTCEAEMDQLTVSGGTVWVCRQRPECRGRRSARSYLKAMPPASSVPV